MFRGRLDPGLCADLASTSVEERGGLRCVYVEGDASGGATMAIPVRLGLALRRRGLWPVSDADFDRPSCTVSICTMASRRLSEPASERVLDRRACFEVFSLVTDEAAVSESQEYSEEEGDVVLLSDGPSFTGLFERDVFSGALVISTTWFDFDFLPSDRDL